MGEIIAELGQGGVGLGNQKAMGQRDSRNATGNSQSAIRNMPFVRVCYNFGVDSKIVAAKTRAQIVVRGIVQGVNYRWFTQRRADEMHLTGYVRNMPDGTVFVVAEGPRNEIEALMDTLRLGPSAAVVESVQVEWHAPSGEFDRFEVRY